MELLGFQSTKPPSLLKDGGFVQIKIYCVVITATTTAAEVVVVAEEVPAELDDSPPPPPPQPANISSIAAAKANTDAISLDDFMATPLELADAAKGIAFSLNQNRITAVNGDCIGDYRDAATRWCKSKRLH
jgi:hypothetical protein